jgi:osmotically-inducible protein OsmY
VPNPLDVHKLGRILILLVATTLLSGCAAAIIGGIAIGASMHHDRRGSGTVVEDKQLGVKIRDRLHQADGPGEDNHIKTVTYNLVVLLLGEVETDSERQRAEEIAASIPTVRWVVNELEVMPQTSLKARSHDAYLNSKAKSVLFGRGIDGFDPTRVDVTTVRDTVYMMGLVTREEADAAAERVSRVRGVEKVIKVFEYQD